MFSRIWSFRPPNNLASPTLYLPTYRRGINYKHYNKQSHWHKASRDESFIFDGGK